MKGFSVGERVTIWLPVPFWKRLWRVLTLGPVVEPHEFVITGYVDAEPLAEKARASAVLPRKSSENVVDFARFSSEKFPNR